MESNEVGKLNFDEFLPQPEKGETMLPCNETYSHAMTLILSPRMYAIEKMFSRRSCLENGIRNHKVYSGY